jgi:hypothetical protein
MMTPEEPQPPMGWFSRYKTLVIVAAVVAIIVLCSVLCAQGSGDKGV